MEEPDPKPELMNEKDQIDLSGLEDTINEIAKNLEELNNMANGLETQVSRLDKLLEQLGKMQAVQREIQQTLDKYIENNKQKTTNNAKQQKDIGDMLKNIKPSMTVNLDQIKTAKTQIETDINKLLERVTSLEKTKTSSTLLPVAFIIAQVVFVVIVSAYYKHANRSMLL